MNREIKFRWKAWDKWVYWSLLIQWENYQIRETDIDWSVHNYTVDPSTVWQFTWLKDKAWKEVYQWDILKYKTSKNQYSEVKFVDDWEIYCKWIVFYIESLK